MQIAELEQLFEQYLNETISPEDLQRLWQTLEQPAFNKSWQRFIDGLSANANLHGLSDAADREKALLQLRNTLELEQHRRPAVTTFAPGDNSATPRITRRFRWYWAAAAVLLLIGGVYLRRQDAPVPETQANSRPARGEISPGQDGAILTLADGSRIVLDSSENGVLATQNGVQVILKDGRLLYDPAKSSAGAPAYNTMTTPKGRQFRMELPDGTRVWLNAESSIHYPTAFTGGQRKVEITGEAYFEVAKDKKAPFKVYASNRAEIEVLGTHFNINAYNSEPSLNTTLLEGALRVRALGAPPSGGVPSPAVTLRPNQQAQLTPASPITVLESVDIEKVMAWKNGLFNFEGIKLREMFRQLERWYDIEVVYEGEVPDVRFFGKASKNMPLTDLLSGLKDLGIRFRIEEGKRVVVTR